MGSSRTPWIAAHVNEGIVVLPALQEETVLVEAVEKMGTGGTGAILGCGLIILVVQRWLRPQWLQWWSQNWVKVG